jgi:hypothetical protein
MTSFPPNDYFFFLMTRDPCPSHSGQFPPCPLPPECQPLALDPFWRLGRRQRWYALHSLHPGSPKKKMRKNWSINLFFVPPQCLCSMDASKRSLAKATADELEEYKKWLRRYYYYSIISY